MRPQIMGLLEEWSFYRGPKMARRIGIEGTRERNASIMKAR
jgi:hypothetical protein